MAKKTNNQEPLKLKSYWEPGAAQIGQENLNKFFLGYPYEAPRIDARGDSELLDIGDMIARGASELYDKNGQSWAKFYRGEDGKIYRLGDWVENMKLYGYTEIPYSEVRKMLPKREYIGGDDYRIRAMMRVPGLVEHIYDRANAYGIDPNLMLYRIGKEGWIDEVVRRYNGLDAAQQNDEFWFGLWGLPVSGAQSFGLDDAGYNLLNGKYELLDPNASWEEEGFTNEKGRNTTSVKTENLKDMLEIYAAELGFRQKEVENKYGVTGKDKGLWTNAAYHRGLSNDKLNDASFVRSNYAYPDYYKQYNLGTKPVESPVQYDYGGLIRRYGVDRIANALASGGRIHIKPSHRGRLTELKERTGKTEAELYNDGNPAHKKMVVFARNSRKWHADGGLINRFDMGGGDENDKLAKAIIAEVNKKEMGRKQDGLKSEAPLVEEHPLADLLLLRGTGRAIKEGAAAAKAITGADLIGALKYAQPSSWIEGAWNAGRGAARAFRGKAIDPLYGTLLKNAPYYTGATTLSGVAADALLDTGFLVHGLRNAGDSADEARQQYQSGDVSLGRAVWNGVTGEAANLINLMPAVAPSIAVYNKARVAIPMAVGKARNYINFMRGDNTEYVNALQRLADFNENELRSLNTLRKLERDNLEGGQFILPIEQKTVTISGQEAPLPAGAQTANWQYGDEAVTIPRTIENLGTPVDVEVTYPTVATGAVGPENTIRFARGKSAYPLRRGNNYKTGDTWRSPLTRTEFPFPDEVNEMGYNSLDVYYPIYQSSQAGKLEPQGKINGGSTLLVQRGGKTNERVAKAVQDISGELGDDGFVGGSSLLYSSGVLSGTPHDTEIITTKSRYKSVANKFGFKESGMPNDYTHEGIGNSKLPQGGEVDIQVIGENGAGEATGPLAWSLFHTMHPDEFSKQASSLFLKSNKAYHEHSPINPATGKAYTADKLLAEFQGGNFALQHVINDALGINKFYKNRGGFDNLLKHNRPMAIMTDDRPEVIEMVRKAIDTNARAQIGPSYVHGSEYFPNIDFTNVEENKKFLDAIHVGKKEIAENPEMMKNLFDYLFLGESSQMRGVDDRVSGYSAKKAILSGNYPVSGADASGGGRNTLRANTDKGATPYAQVGSMQTFPSYADSRPDVTTTDQALELFRRTRDHYRFNDGEGNKAISTVQSMIADIRSQAASASGIDSMSLKNDADILEKIISGYSGFNTTGELDNLIRDIHSSRLSHKFKEGAIDAISQSVDIPFFSPKFSTYGNNYRGIYSSKQAKTASVRNIGENNNYSNPFEIGRPLGSYAEKATGSSSISGSEVVPYMDESGAELYNTLHAADLRKDPFAYELEKVGAQYEPNVAAQQLRDLLQTLRDNSEEGEKLQTLLQKYERYPFAGSARKSAQMDAGVSFTPWNSSTSRLGPSQKMIKEYAHVTGDAAGQAPFIFRNFVVDTSESVAGNYDWIKNIKPSDVISVHKVPMSDSLMDIEIINPETGQKLVCGVSYDSVIGKYVIQPDILPFSNGGHLRGSGGIIERYGKDRISQAIAKMKQSK